MPEASAGEVHRIAREVLAQDAYDDVRPGLLDRLWGLVLDGVGRLMDLLEASGVGTPLGALVLVLVAGVLVALGVRGVTRVRRSPSAEPPEVAVGGRSAADWLADAASAEEDGRLREAVRCRYRALVAELAALGLVEEVPGRTAGEYRAEVSRAAPAAAPHFARATEGFEVAWYAEREITRRDVAEIAEAAAAALRAAGSPAAARAGSSPGGVGS